LQEYDFEIIHRAGVKHTNADVLSRFPAASSKDFSGAQLDPDVAAAARAMLARAVPVTLSGIDGFAPRFKDLLRAGSPHIADHTYMDEAMRDPTLDELDPAPKRHITHVTKAVSAVVRDMSMSPSFPSKVQASIDESKQMNEWYKPPPFGAGLRTHALDTSIVGPTFFPAVRQEGLVLIELCAGIGTMLHALLRAGVRIRYYYYADVDPIARTLMREQLFNLSAKYPDTFPITAHAAAFDLPQDISQISRDHLRDQLSWEQLPYLITAGWPCQEYSPAGKGQVGARAALLDDVLRIVRYIQERSKRYPPAYILENVAMQMNFRHWHVSNPVFEELMSRIGHPITFDAVQVGSRAHRLRNYWTNLVEGGRANAVFERVFLPARGPVSEILGPGRQPVPVRADERAQSGIQVNRFGEPRKVFPTFTAFPTSRAFRPGKPGSIFDTSTNSWDEPNALEREAAMGYELGYTDVAGLTDRQRCQLLGQAMDVRALLALWLVCSIMCKAGVASRPEALHSAAQQPPNLANLPVKTTGCAKL
jgi:Site-specific DNA methylase